jgi:hypothetical protein
LIPKSKVATLGHPGWYLFSSSKHKNDTHWTIQNVTYLVFTQSLHTTKRTNNTVLQPKKIAAEEGKERKL